MIPSNLSLKLIASDGGLFILNPGASRIYCQFICIAARLINSCCMVKLTLLEALINKCSLQPDTKELNWVCG